MTSGRLLGILVVAAAPLLAVAQPGPTREEVFLEAWRVAANAFYDPAMHGVDWDAVRTELSPRAAAATSQAALSAVINEALGRLHASHTEHLIPEQREYYELLDVFYPEGIPEKVRLPLPPGPVSYVGIGLATRSIEGRVFAADVYDDGPAAKAGLLAGDELLGVEDGPWGDVVAFRDRAGLATRLRVRRGGAAESPREIMVTPERIRPRELFLRAERASARIIEHDRVKVGYVRLRSYAHPDYHDLLKDLVGKELAGADALVVDIRGGWGGASPAYMDLFNPRVPVMTFQMRDAGERTMDLAWRRPAGMIIDGGSRSGKEVIAYAFKKHGVGPLIGERTAGAVLAGTPRALADGSILYLAIQGVRIDGEVLEGVGVAPDVAVARELPFSAGRDPQVDAAVAAVAARVPRTGR